MAKKLHVEIGIDGEKSVAIVGGSGVELIAAACFALNAFYEALAKEGADAAGAFKRIMQAYVASDDSIVWKKGI